MVDSAARDVDGLTPRQGGARLFGGHGHEGARAGVGQGDDGVAEEPAEAFGRRGWCPGLARRGWPTRPARRVPVIAEEDQWRARQVDLAQGGRVGQAVSGVPGLEARQLGARVEDDEAIVIGEPSLEDRDGPRGVPQGGGELCGGHGDTAARAQDGGGAVKGRVGHGGLRFLSAPSCMGWPQGGMAGRAGEKSERDRFRDDDERR
jgi:hypothetical protein